MRQAEEAILKATLQENKFIPHVPTVTQARFLLCMDREALYGGSAGGGKSDALLMAALQFVDLPSYHAIIFRRTFTDLSLPGALMERAHQWLTGKAHWDGTTKTWTFPSGSTLSFGYLDTETAKYRYQGAEFQFIAFDELTQFEETQYTYLFSRLRRTSSPVPLRMRAASNPGGVGHEWVKERFITGPATFFPATLEDNPYLDRESYLYSLQQLDPVTRAQLLSGDWDMYKGARFDREWFKEYSKEGDYYVFPDHDPCHEADVWKFMTVDPAASAENSSDYTAMGVFARPNFNACLVLDVVRKHLVLEDIVPEIAFLSEKWKPAFVGIESLAFQAFLLVEARRDGRIGTVRPLSPHAEARRLGQRLKLARATPAILWASRGKIYLPRSAPWKAAFIDEVGRFTGDPKLDAYDDQVDVLAYAILEMDRNAIPDHSLIEQRTVRAALQGEEGSGGDSNAGTFGHDGTIRNRNPLTRRRRSSRR